MSTWLSLVIGVIIGLLFGWLIDLFWRRRSEPDRPADVAVEPSRAVEWTLPQPAPVAEPPGLFEAEPAVEPAALAAAEVEAPPEVEALPDVEARLDVEAPPKVEVLPLAELTPEVEAEAPEVDLGEVDLDKGVVDWPEISERVAHVGEELQETVAEVREEIVELPEKAGRFVSGALDALAPAKDDLLRIEGIGPVYAGRLRAAGINTFAELAGAGESVLQGIIQPQAWQRVVFADWIEQARLIVEGNEEGLRVLQEKLFRRKKG